jgi:hypothetical protein
MKVKVGHYYLIPYPILKNQLYSSEQKMAVAICVKNMHIQVHPIGFFNYYNKQVGMTTQRV